MKNDFSHIFLLYQGKEPDMARINRQNRRTERDSRLERISRMEDRYNEVMRKLTALEEAVADYGHLKREIDVLEDYMSSGLWQKDYEADEAGEIPADLPRGVLSEDGLYNLLEDAGRIIGQAREVWGGR